MSHVRMMGRCCSSRDLDPTHWRRAAGLGLGHLSRHDVVRFTRVGLHALGSLALLATVVIVS
jgi:hypothetical protein